MLSGKLWEVHEEEFGIFSLPLLCPTKFFQKNISLEFILLLLSLLLLLFGYYCSLDAVVYGKNATFIDLISSHHLRDILAL